jgi:hypothetical protein
MNPTSSSSPRWLAALTIATAFPLHGATVTLNSADTLGNSSFASAGNWNPSGAPATGNTYNVAIPQLRTPPDANSYTFQGDSLSINTGGSFLYKGGGTTGIITVPNLILNGGKLDHASSFADVFTIGGALQVTTASTIEARQGPIVINSVMTGTAALTLPVTNNNNAYSVTFKGTNTYTGSIAVAGNLILDPAGTLTFAIGANGVNNTISGAGSAAINGTFNLDLTNAGNTVGNQWTLVNAATLVETFGATFNIAGFVENNGFWTSADGNYQFNEATGVLTRITADTDGDGLPDSWETTYFSSLAYGPLDDPDGDYANNQLEQQNSTNPNLATSYPDTDLDGLNDGWERYFFNNSLVQLATGDPDGDHNTNAAEMAAETDPNNAFAFPDDDDDELNDGWEIFYFGSLAAGVPDIDSDGDLFLNVDEMWSGTNPTSQISSPDTDNEGGGDGLPDGWEVKYFRVGAETLAEAITHQNSTGDPDGDGVTNKLELLAGTDPTSAASVQTTLGYWRFEEATAGEVPAGGNGQYLYPTSIQDSSAYGNHMMAWADYSRPNYTAVVPSLTVPTTSASNTGSLFFQRNGNGIYYIEAIFSTPTGYLGGGQATLRNYAFNSFTVEASFNTNLTGQWQVPVSKHGNTVAGQPPFSIKIDTANKLRAGMVDGSGVAREIIGTSTIAANSWYSTAVTATATELKLWLKKPGDAAYVLEGTVAISGAWYVPAGGAMDNAWNIGQGMWNGTATDAFQGNIDEVRISAVALPESSFLFHEDGSPFQLWAAQNIPDAGLRGETADPDGDGTSNLVEFKLGLNPMSGTSFFAGNLSGSTLTWPAADGLQFTIQRSTTLGAWDTITTVTATGSTGSWTDLSPPPGKAFYRVVFTE